MSTSDERYIDVAAERVEEIVRWNSRGGGDTQKAMKQVSRRYGIPYGVLWALRYRRPKGIFWDVVEKIKTAYAAECHRQAVKISERINDIAGEHGHEIAEAVERPIGDLLRREGAPVQYPSGSCDGVLRN
ncbi:hypothetical protein ACJ4V0_15890 [Phreatobacter sp. HK31-P]